MNKPSLIQKAVSVTKAGIRWVVAGFPSVLGAQYERRLQACKDCRHYNEGECRLCGCPVKRKALLGTEDCPVEKWS